MMTVKVKTTCARATGSETSRPTCTIHGEVIKNGKVYAILTAGSDTISVVCNDCRKLLNATHRLFKHERPVVMEREVD